MIEAENPHPVKKRRARLSPLTVIGELLVLAGVGVFGFIVWQPWHTGYTVVKEQAKISSEHSALWERQAQEAPAEGDPEGSSETEVIPVMVQPAEGEIFGVLYVPAFGEDFSNVLAEGVDRPSVLNAWNKGIGKYPTTTMPGQPGNTAYAAHRSGGWSTPFREVMNLRVGDHMYIETPDGWYTYRFRSIEYVWPDEGNVLSPFPRLEGEVGTDQILTLTTCHPKWAGSAERAISYAVFEDFQPRADGPPATLAAVTSSVGGA